MKQGDLHTKIFIDGGDPAETRRSGTRVQPEAAQGAERSE